MTTDARNFTARLTLWQRIAWWDRWPWRLMAIRPDERSWDARWVTVVRLNGTVIGWHLDQQRPTGFVLRPDRWACLYGLVTGRLHFEVEVDPGEKPAPVLECRHCRRGLIGGPPVYEHDWSLDAPGSPRTCERPEPNRWQLEREGAEPLSGPQQP